MAPALTKIAKKGIESAADFLKSFSDKVYYHITTKDIKEFDPNISAKKGLYPKEDLDYLKGNKRGATYFTKDLNFVDEMLDSISKDVGKVNEDFYELNTFPTGTNILPVRIKEDNIFDITNKKHINKLENTTSDNQEFMLMTFIKAAQEGNLPIYKALENHHIQRNLKEAGFRGYKTDESGTVGMFYPEDIRSVFGKFDPKKSSSGNILASGLVGYGAFGGLDGKSSN